MWDDITDFLTIVENFADEIEQMTKMFTEWEHLKYIHAWKNPHYTDPQYIKNIGTTQRRTVTASIFNRKTVKSCSPARSNRPGGRK